VISIRTSVALTAAALLIAACGGQSAASDGTTTAKTKAQIGAEKLLKEYEAVPGCGCTGPTRAKERAATLFTYAGEGLAAKTR
jgi:hypothetical protein